MLKSLKSIKNGILFTIPNGAALQAAIKEKQAAKEAKKSKK